DGCTLLGLGEPAARHTKTRASARLTGRCGSKLKLPPTPVVTPFAWAQEMAGIAQATPTRSRNGVRRALGDSMVRHRKVTASAREAVRCGSKRRVPPTRVVTPSCTAQLTALAYQVPAGTSATRAERARGSPLARHRKVTSSARGTGRCGSDLEREVPVVIPARWPQATASA